MQHSATPVSRTLLHSPFNNGGLRQLHVKRLAVPGTSTSNAGTTSNSSTTSSSNGAIPNASHQPQPAAASGAPPPGTAGTAAAAAAGPPGVPGAPAGGALLRPIYVLIFGLIFVGGMLFASMSLQLTSDMGFGDAFVRITRRIFRSIAFRQLVVIAVAMFLVRFALNNVLRVLAKWSSSPVPWDKSKVYYVMKEVSHGWFVIMAGSWA